MGQKIVVVLIDYVARSHAPALECRLASAWVRVTTEDRGSQKDGIDVGPRTSAPTYGMSLMGCRHSGMSLIRDPDNPELDLRLSHAGMTNESDSVLLLPIMSTGL
jgi:hypothetical protein